MKNQFVKFLMFSLTSCLILTSCAKQARIQQVAEQPAQTPVSTPQAPKGQAINSGEFFYVYQDFASRENHYIPSGWMGDYGDMKIVQNCTISPQSGKFCIEIKYDTKKRSQGAGWAGIFWQNPANNWGDMKGGYNLTGAKRLTFWARGEKGGEILNEVKIGGIRGVYSDSDSTAIGPITLTKEWKKYTIDLTGLDLSYISGGFCWATSADMNPGGMTFYFDEIRYEFK